MRTVILGKKIENTYSVDHKWKTLKDSEGNEKTVYIDKPNIIKKVQIKDWVELCSYEGEPHYNSPSISSSPSSWIYNHLNISDDETVTVTESIFRADLNEMHLRTNKIIAETHTDLEESKNILNEQIRAFNSMMIQSNHRLKSYCDIHNLCYEDTDVIILFSIVFPDKRYEIVDGVMQVKDTRGVRTACDFSDTATCIDSLQSSLATICKGDSGK